MDAKDSTVRRYLAQRAELLGAIRLPNDCLLYTSQNTMPTKAELYAQMADKVATQLTGSWQEWACLLYTSRCV